IGSGSAAVTPVNFAELSAGLLVSLSVGPLTDTQSYTFSVSPVSGGSPLYRISGTAPGPAFGDGDFTYLDRNTTGNCYFNNLNLTREVPDPTALSLLGGGVTLGLLWLASTSRKAAMPGCDHR